MVARGGSWFNIGKATKCRSKSERDWAWLFAVQVDGVVQVGAIGREVFTAFHALCRLRYVLREVNVEMHVLFAQLSWRIKLAQHANSCTLHVLPQGCCAVLARARRYGGSRGTGRVGR